MACFSPRIMYPPNCFRIEFAAISGRAAVGTSITFWIVPPVMLVSVPEYLIVVVPVTPLSCQ